MRNRRTERDASHLEPLPREFYDRPAEEVARDLLGKHLIRRAVDGIVSGRIVEVEAYRDRDDPASHADRGRTRRNASMFGRPGLAYVFSIHSRFCLNAVVQPAGTPAAVLIRAVAPLHGVAVMQRRRGVDRLLDLARGPARLCEAFGIDRRMDGYDLTRGTRLWIAHGPDADDDPPLAVASSGRIGISSAEDLLLRFFADGDPFVSGPRRLGTAASRPRVQ